MRKPWYDIKNLASGAAELAIYDDIGGWGINAQQMLADLESVKERDLNIRMNTRGGDVFEGIAIYSAIKRIDNKVTCMVDSLAASIGSVIAMAADEILIAPPAKMMIHEAHGGVQGDAAEARKFADLLEGTSDTIAKIYAERTGGSHATWRERMREETWYNADEAVDAGLADGILSGNKKREASPEKVLESAFDYGSVVAALKGVGQQ